MLDAILPALNVAALQSDDIRVDSLTREQRTAMIDAARKGANSTASIDRALFGRAQYVPSSKLIKNDAGAEALSIIIESFIKDL